MRLKILIAFFLFQGLSLSQEIIGARAFALKSYVAVANDPWTIFYNPAGISSLRTREVAFSYIPAQFELAELSQKGIAYYEPSLPVKFALGARIFGFELYRELILKLAFARDFKFFSIGGSLSYNSISIKNYGSDGGLGFDLGLISNPIKFLRFGFVLKNMISERIGKAKEKLPSVLEIGLAFVPYENLTVSSSVEKVFALRESFKYGVEYMVEKWLCFRIGLLNFPTRFSAGIGINYFIFNLDYSVDKHQMLGLTHQITIALRLGEK